MYVGACNYEGSKAGYLYWWILCFQSLQGTYTGSLSILSSWLRNHCHCRPLDRERTTFTWLCGHFRVAIMPRDCVAVYFLSWCHDTDERWVPSASIPEGMFVLQIQICIIPIPQGHDRYNLIDGIIVCVLRNAGRQLEPFPIWWRISMPIATPASIRVFHKGHDLSRSLARDYDVRAFSWHLAICSRSSHLVAIFSLLSGLMVSLFLWSCPCLLYRRCLWQTNLSPWNKDGVPRLMLKDEMWMCGQSTVHSKDGFSGTMQHTDSHMSRSSVDQCLVVVHNPISIVMNGSSKNFSKNGDASVPTQVISCSVLWLFSWCSNTVSICFEKEYNSSPAVVVQDFTLLSWTGRRLGLVIVWFDFGFVQWILEREMICTIRSTGGWLLLLQCCNVVVGGKKLGKTSSTSLAQRWMLGKIVGVLARR